MPDALAILTAEDAAPLLRCEPTTMEEHARSGFLPAVKIGRTWLFPRAALEERLNELARQNVPAPDGAPTTAAAAAPTAAPTRARRTTRGHQAAAVLRSVPAPAQGSAPAPKGRQRRVLPTLPDLSGLTEPKGVA